jgi:hypothetical protein
VGWVPNTIEIVFGTLLVFSNISVICVLAPVFIAGILYAFVCCNVKNRSYLPNLTQPYCSNPIFIDNFAPHEQEEKIDISVHSGV